MSRFRHFIFPIVITGILIIFTGCSEDVFTGKAKDNIPPVVTITSAPIERSSTSYKIHIYWDSSDPDGKVRYCQYCIVSGDPYGFSPADTIGDEKWTDAIDENNSVYNDMLFSFACDSVPLPYGPNPDFTRFEKTHTFFIRAVDSEWAVSKVQHVSFTSWTLAPTVTITEPPGDRRSYSTVITFGWTASDPIDSPFNAQPPESVRYYIENLETIKNFLPPGEGDNLVYDVDLKMNEYPELFENGWKSWIKYSLSDSGSTVKIGPIQKGSYCFAVQAKDEAGAITAIMERNKNLRTFSASESGINPSLTVSESTIGGASFSGFAGKANEVDLPPGVKLNFTWNASAFEYGGKIVAYRYGWDISNLDNPDEWAVTWGLEHRNTTRTWYSGTHNLYIQVKDDGGRITNGIIRIKVIEFGMERDVLLVDDWACSEFDFNGLMPKESVHDQFLETIIGERVPDFDPETDVYDFISKSRYIKIEELSHYKNIIWIYGDVVSAVGDETSNWRENIYFVPDSEAGAESRINLIKLFLKAGGHLLSYGLSGRSWGGLSDCFDLRTIGEGFPVVVSQDLVEDEDDDSWRNCMPYDDYGADVLDRVRYYEFMLHQNSMTTAYLDRSDPVTAMYPGLPDSLVLRPDLTSSGRHWDSTLAPNRCGFWFVETFNAPRVMEEEDVYETVEWFHPMYRMKACSSLSKFEDAPVALILTKNADIQPFSSGGISANSFHFGFPLWYFEREKVEKIYDIIFTEWRIRE